MEELSVPVCWRTLSTKAGKQFFESEKPVNLSSILTFPFRASVVALLWLYGIKDNYISVTKKKKKKKKFRSQVPLLTYR